MDGRCDERASTSLSFVVGSWTRERETKLARRIENGTLVEKREILRIGSVRVLDPKTHCRRWSWIASSSSHPLAFLSKKEGRIGKHAFDPRLGPTKERMRSFSFIPSSEFLFLLRMRSTSSKTWFVGSLFRPCLLGSESLSKRWERVGNVWTSDRLYLGVGWGGR